MPNKHEAKRSIEQALENMEAWSVGIDLTDEPRGWFSNNWVLSGSATESTEAGSHHITWQNPPQITQAKHEKPKK